MSTKTLDKYYAIQLGMLPTVVVSMLVLFAATVGAAAAIFFGLIAITEHSTNRIIQQNEMLIVALNNLTSGTIPVYRCDTNGTDQGVFIVQGHTIVVNPAVSPTVIRFNTSGVDVTIEGNATANRFDKNGVSCCQIVVQGAECVWDNTTMPCGDGNGGWIAGVIPTLGVCQVNLGDDQVIGVALLSPSPGDTADTLVITHPFVVFAGALYVNGTHKLPASLQEVLLAWNNSRAFTGSQLFPCGLHTGSSSGEECGTTPTGNMPYDLTMTSFYTGRGGTTVNSDTLQSDQRNAPTTCAAGYPISPNPYVASSDQDIDASTIFQVPISQLAEDILRCGNVNEDLPVPASATPESVFDPSRTWATTPIFPIAAGAVYRIDFGTELINFYMTRDDDDGGLQAGTGVGVDEPVGCGHYFAAALDDDETCLSDGEIRDNQDSNGNSGSQQQRSPGRKKGCDAQGRAENVGPVALQLYALCMAVGVTDPLYQSVQGLVRNMFVPLHHHNPVIIDLSEGAKTHKMRGHLYVVVDDTVFNNFPGYFGQCAMFSAATPFYMDKNFAEAFPHLHSERDIDHGTAFANPLNTTFGADHYYGYNHFCRASNVVPANSFIEVHVTVPGIDTPAATVAATSQVGTGGFSLKKRGVDVVRGAYEDVGKLSAEYWRNFIDPATGKPDWNVNVQPVHQSRKRFVNPHEALAKYRDRMLREGGVSQPVRKKPDAPPPKPKHDSRAPEKKKSSKKKKKA